MIESREHLIHVLTEAAEIEHNLLCSYLYAASSLKRAGEGGLTLIQAEAVERWRKSVLSVALQEMAHRACVNNLLIAVGGAPYFDRPNLPVAPGYHPGGVVIRLTPLDAATLEHFIYLERPDASELRDADRFETETPSGRREAARGRLTPSAIDYETIGHLYDALADAFRRLSSRLGEAVLIDAEGRGQLDSNTVKLPDVPRIVELQSALAAIDQIKEQGEGSSGGHKDSHFDRFRGIRAEWAALLAEDSRFEPAWPAACDPVMRRPPDRTTRVWVTDPLAADYLDLGNALYGTMLVFLSEAFSGVPETQAKALMAASVEMMEGCAAIGAALARLPADAGRPGVNAGMSFAMPRNIGGRPRGTTVLAIERVIELQQGAERILIGEAREKTLRRLTGARTALTKA